MKNSIFFIVAGLVILSFPGYSQTMTQVDSLQAMAQRESKIISIRKTHAIEWAKLNGYPIRTEIDGSLLDIQYIGANGRPQYYKTDNSNSAATISTNKVYSGGGAGLSLTGSGITVREWDGGSVMATHQEFGARVTVVDAVATHYHSTHVAGTIMASGVVASAKGMAFAANLRSFDWDFDVSEMATEAAAGALISNHSYGYTRGWYSGTWYGDPAISVLEDYLFGFYDSETQQWDQIALNAPYFLICKSAGNDRGNSGSGYPPDGPYDCIGQQGIAKNILTVGAVDDIPGGYTTPAGVVQTNTYFSSWGPADDGRIKPDIVANGYSLYSTYNTNNTSYQSLSGTSMASPSAAGSLALLQQHYHTLTGNYMRSATLKALVIHTADEAGPNTGPDYMFGWGLMNTKNAALKISADQTTDVISELTLNNGATYTREIIALGTEPIKVTIVWTDRVGTPPAPSLDPINPMLVNDLDLRITRAGNTYYSWKLDRDNPANAATNASENNVDNVEVVYIASPVAGATYTITVDHDGSLSGGPQAYSMILSGILSTVPPVADFIASNTNPSINTQVNFTDISANVPTTWSWSFSPATVIYVNGTTSASQNPQVQFTAAGAYNVTLTATNAYGTDIETKSNYITVINCTVTTLPFNENFPGTTLPACWTQVDHQGNGQIWQFGVITGYTPNPALTGNYAYLNSDAYGSGNSQNVDLITPTLNLSPYTGITLQFSHYFRSYSGSAGTLSYSINNGTNWTQIQQFTTTSASNPATFNQVIAALAGQSQVKFKWNYTGTWGYYWGIDNIQVTGTCISTPPVSVAIAATANPVCAGTSVTFNAIPANGGSNPAYQWKVNSINAGTNNSAFTHTPISNDQVSCVLTSNAVCVTGNPGTSNTVTMTVNPLLPVSVSIVASANPVEQGIPVTFTATPVNGGATPVYQWVVNGLNAGTNSNVYTYVPLNNDIVSCNMTSDELCTIANPVSSNSVTMVVTTIVLTVELQNMTVTGTQCFNAAQTISVAGNGTTFTVPNGNSATMIAGQNIFYYPGTIIAQGGSMMGYIAPGGPWCEEPAIAVVTTGTENRQTGPDRQYYRIYPNPTTSVFMIEFNKSDESKKYLFEIYDMKGAKIISDNLSGDWKYEFSLSDRPAGIYLIRIIGEGILETTRIIKQQ